MLLGSGSSILGVGCACICVCVCVTFLKSEAQALSLLVALQKFASTGLYVSFTPGPGGWTQTKKCNRQHPLISISVRVQLSIIKHQSSRLLSRPKGQGYRLDVVFFPMQDRTRAQNRRQHQDCQQILETTKKKVESPPLLYSGLAPNRHNCALYRD